MGNFYSFNTFMEICNEWNETETETPKYNSYLTWSVTLYALYKAKLSKDYEFLDYVNVNIQNSIIAVNDNEEITIDTILYTIIDNFGDELTLSDFKDFDLGGRDQEMKSSIDQDIPPQKDIANKFVLLTGGEIKDRISNLKVFSDYYSNSNKFFFALKPDAETLFSGLSIINYLKKNTNDFGKNTLIVPVGSTDAHFIFIDEYENIHIKNIINYKKSSANWEKEMKELIVNEDIKRIVFGGSFLFGLDHRKFLEDESQVQRGVDVTDINFEKKLFKSISQSTGKVMLGKIMASFTDKFDFTFVTNNSTKGIELNSFLNNIFNNDYIDQSSYSFSSGNYFFSSCLSK